MKRIIPLVLAACLFNSVLVCARQPAVGSPPPADALTELTAAEALELLESGALTSEQYVSALLARADELQGLNVFITRDSEGALSAARAADQRRAAGLPCGRLCGLPFVVKDNINSAGLRTTAGTPALASHQPAANAAAVQRLLDEGAVLVGKTNMHELA
ncbi:MAG TPA: amidase family protein, partial [Pyrinomonadaceae bacterium]|nr:amidase family protein [Pyrinomonadaceae bacterium]